MLRMSGFLQNLSDADAVVFRLEGFDMPDFTGLPAPGMVNQQFCVGQGIIIILTNILLVRK